MKWYKYNINDMTEKCYERYLGMMDPERRERVQKKARREDRLRSVAAELLLRRAVSEILGISEGEVGLYSDENGAPRIRQEGVFVSISHSGDYAVCAVSDRPVGIDIEEIRPICARVAIGTFSAGEMEYLSCDGYEFSEEALVRFYEIWTAKEAYAKMMGTGISLKSTKDTTELDNINRAHFDTYVVSVITK